MMNEGAGQIAQLAGRLGVTIVTLRVFGPDHIILAVVEADDIEAVKTSCFRAARCNGARRTFTRPTRWTRRWRGE
jgi:hypothetical protein